MVIKYEILSNEPSFVYAKSRFSHDAAQLYHFLISLFLPKIDPVIFNVDIQRDK